MAHDHPKGYLCLVLHAHLPFVRHPEHEYCVEENWLYEAITETYIPLLEMMKELSEEGVHFRLAMSITPPLASMLSDSLLQGRYLRHIEELIALGEKEEERTRNQPEFHAVVSMYRRKFADALRIFRDRYQCDLVKGFRSFQDLGVLEIITCGATHAFLPLMEEYPNAVHAQVAVGCQSYAEHFGRAPRGTWNAECGYFPGLDRVLARNGIRYFFADSHALLNAAHAPSLGVHAPLYCPTGVAVFGRDIESSKSVWSAEEGYPGDFVYREFYRDIGFDLDMDYIGPHMHQSELRLSTGMKYYRITGRPCDLPGKQPYDPAAAREMVGVHAGNFMFNRELQAEHLAEYLDRPALIVSPYDAELFGHWWYEGPDFLKALLRKIHYESDILETITPSEYLERYPLNQVAEPSFSSWGYKGFSEVWLEGSNDWIYRHLHRATGRMIELANRYRWETDSVRVRMLNQAARELLLAQSSDWAFIMKTATMVDYAVGRTKDHLLNFRDLWRMLNDWTSNVAYLEDLESRHNIFPNIDFRVFADPQ